jgi:hypothetical protein
LATYKLLLRQQMFSHRSLNCFPFFHSFLSLFISGFLSTLHFPSHPQQGFLRHGIADLQFPGGLEALRKNTFGFYKCFRKKFLILFRLKHSSPGSSVGRAWLLAALIERKKPNGPGFEPLPGRMFFLFFIFFLNPKYVL